MSAFVLKKSTFSNRWTDMIFVKKFTLPHFPTKIEQWREGQISSLPLKETYSSRKSWRAWDTFSGWPSCNRTCCSKLKSYQFILFVCSQVTEGTCECDNDWSPFLNKRKLVFQLSKKRLFVQWISHFAIPGSPCETMSFSSAFTWNYSTSVNGRYGLLQLRMNQQLKQRLHPNTITRPISSGAFWKSGLVSRGCTILELCIISNLFE